MSDCTRPHALVTNPSNPLQFWEGSDGGIVRSDGTLADVSSRCDGRSLTGASLTRCKQLLSAVPGSYTSLNKGLQTLQFQSLSVNPANPKDVQGGTQDNGTFETSGSSVTWPQTINGDGGLSGFDATNPDFRFHTYFSQQVDVSFQAGAPPSWDWIADPLFAETALFYFPIITDPSVHGTMFAGLQHVWRTLDNGGPQAYLDSNCNEFTGTFTNGTTCGDWVQLGNPASGGRLTSRRTRTQAARTGRSLRRQRQLGLTRVERQLDAVGVHDDRSRLHLEERERRERGKRDVHAPRHARCKRPGTGGVEHLGRSGEREPRVISYLSYNPLSIAPGHVFSVTYNPTAGTATWTSLDGTGAGSIGDQPVNGVAFDPATTDLYAATDFGAFKLAGANPANGWAPAADGLPVVTVSGLTVNPGSRQLLAATHGRGAYQLTLP